MKILHLADLHLGKSIHGISLIDQKDQVVWVERFLDKVEEIDPSVIVVAGDVYDRSAPSGDAVMLFDHLLTKLERKNIPVMIVAGNHDSGQRLSFAGDILSKQNIYISGVLEKKIVHKTLEDEHGPVTFWLLPYIFPAMVADILEDPSIRDYDTAVRRLLAEQSMDFTRRNVIVAHQNVTCNGKTVEFGGSETMVGGVGQIDYTAFDGFDYVALGHIHSSYPVGRASIRYAGSPLCYHFDEIRQPQKGPILVELGEKGSDIKIQTQYIEPLHKMRIVKGTYAEICAELEENRYEGEYIKVVVTDQRISPSISEYVKELCRQRNSIVMELQSSYHMMGNVGDTMESSVSSGKQVEEYFEELYRERLEDIEPDEKEQALFQFIGEQVRSVDFAEKQREPGAAEVDKLLAFLMEQEG